MRGLRIFLVHGRDLSAVQELKDWFARNGSTIEIVTLADLSVMGETIPQELERVANSGDAAIILATPDDFGSLGHSTAQPRARQNVWLEFGWFWGRLGRRRSLLLVKGQVEAPSDTAGVLYVPFVESISEVEQQLHKFLARVNDAIGDDVTEVLRTDFNPSSRTADYQGVTSDAQRDLTITGIGMANVRHDLPHIIGTLVPDRPNLQVTFVVLDENYIAANEKVASTLYRPSLDADIRRFEEILRATLENFPASKPRVKLRKYSGLITFVATVADAGELGSLMTVDTILPAEKFHELARPRLMLRRRVAGGIYDRYWAAIKRVHDAAKQVAL